MPCEPWDSLVTIDTHLTLQRPGRSLARLIPCVADDIRRGSGQSNALYPSRSCSWRELHGAHSFKRTFIVDVQLISAQHIAAFGQAVHSRADTARLSRQLKDLRMKMSDRSVASPSFDSPFRFSLTVSVLFPPSFLRFLLLSSSLPHPHSPALSVLIYIRIVHFLSGLRRGSTGGVTPGPENHDLQRFCGRRHGSAAPRDPAADR